jgi:hypothetical protein
LQSSKLNALVPEECKKKEVKVEEESVLLSKFIRCIGIYGFDSHSVDVLFNLCGVVIVVDM